MISKTQLKTDLECLTYSYLSPLISFDQLAQ